MTFHVERIDHVVLRVRDLAGMVRFYEQALGFREERRLDRLNLVQMRAGASMLDLTWTICASASIHSIVTPSSRN